MTKVMRSNQVECPPGIGWRGSRGMAFGPARLSAVVPVPAWMTFVMRHRCVPHLDW